MEKNNVEEYIEQLKGTSGYEKEMGFCSLKKELANLNQSSKVFENFERESMSIGKDALQQMQDLSSLIRLRSLASEIKNKNKINDQLHALHSNLNILKNTSRSDASSIKNVIDIFLHRDDTKIDNIINEMNDFKAKLDEIKKHHSSLLPKSLDNKLNMENKYSKHIEQLHSIHKKQKNVLAATIKLFLKLTKNHIKNLQKFK